MSQEVSVKAPRLRSGFTVVELIVVIAIFLVTASTTLPFLGAFEQTETVRTIGQDVLQTLRRAQHRAMNGQRDLAWGVAFRNGGFTLYGGGAYTERVPGLDEEHEIEHSYTFIGPSAITFAKVTGIPSPSGIITVMHPDGGQARIAVNAAGGISLQ